MRGYWCKSCGNFVPDGTAHLCGYKPFSLPLPLPEPPKTMFVFSEDVLRRLIREEVERALREREGNGK